MNILLASMGKCASMMFYDALVQTGHFKSWQFQKHILDINIAKYKTPVLLKTHSVVPGNLPAGFKAIFMFANPLQVVLSTHRGLDPEPLKLHYSHFNRRLTDDMKRQKTYLKKDTMGLEALFAGWHQSHSFPMLFIRYETMWENIDKINDFLGFKIELPVYRKQKNYCKELNEKDYNNLYETYLPLLKMITEAKDVEQM